METTKQPYELLFRWNTEGELSGAHVQWRYVTVEGGVRVAEQVTEAQPVAIGAADGFPLDDVLSQTLTDAITARDQAIQAQQEAAAENSKLRLKVLELEKELTQTQEAIFDSNDGG